MLFFNQHHPSKSKSMIHNWSSTASSKSLSRLAQLYFVFRGAQEGSIYSRCPATPTADVADTSDKGVTRDR